MQKKIYQTKTFWTGLATVLAAAAGYYSGTMDTGTAIQTGLAGIMAICLRDGMITGNASPAHGQGKDTP